MGWYFRKSLKVAPGVRLNLGKRTAGLSVGPRGARLSVNARGRRSLSFGRGGFFFRNRV